MERINFKKTGNIQEVTTKKQQELKPEVENNSDVHQITNGKIKLYYIHTKYVTQTHKGMKYMIQPRWTTKILC